MKSEEDLYVIDKNLGESNYFFRQIKRLNSWSNYTNLVRTMSYVTFQKYTTVFSFEDKSDYIYLIMKGSVAVLLPDSYFEKSRYSVEVKRNATKQLQLLSNIHPGLAPLIKKKSIELNMEDIAINNSFKEQNQEGNQYFQPNINGDMTIEPQNFDESIIKLIHPGMFISTRLGPCDSFGEIGVQFKVPRSSTVICLSECELASIPANSFTSLYNKQLFSEDKFINRLKKINGLFKYLSTDKLVHFARNMEVRTISAGEVIFKIGDKPQWVYFIERGEVIISQNFNLFDIRPPSNDMRVNYRSDISKQNSIYDNYYMKLAVCTLGEGSYFGEDGVFFQRFDMKRTTQAIAKEQSIIFKMKSDFFYNNLKALLEGEGLNAQKIKNKLQSMICEEDDETAINHDNSSGSGAPKSYLLHEHAKQSSKGKKVYVQIEDDFLNVRGLKKDLFTIYEEEKLKFRGYSSSNITHLPLSSDCITAEEYLYPQFEANLNPNLFVKKEQKCKIIKNCPSNSRRSSSQLLRVSCSERFMPFRDSNGEEDLGFYRKINSIQALQQISYSRLQSGKKSKLDSTTQLDSPLMQSRKFNSSYHLKFSPLILEEINPKKDKTDNLKYKKMIDLLPSSNTASKTSSFFHQLNKQERNINSSKCDSFSKSIIQNNYERNHNNSTTIEDCSTNQIPNFAMKNKTDSKSKSTDVSRSTSQQKLYSITKSIKENDEMSSQTQPQSSKYQQFLSNQQNHFKGTPISFALQQQIHSRMSTPIIKDSANISIIQLNSHSISTHKKYELKNDQSMDKKMNLSIYEKKNKSNHSRSVGISSVELSNLECHEKIWEQQSQVNVIEQKLQEDKKKKYGIDSKSIMKGKLKFLVDAQDSLNYSVKTALQYQTPPNKKKTKSLTKFDEQSSSIIHHLSNKIIALKNKQTHISNNNKENPSSFINFLKEQSQPSEINKKKL